jgi:hypothetical protein
VEPVAAAPYDEPATEPLRPTVPGAQAEADVVQAYGEWHDDLFGFLTSAIVIIGDTGAGETRVLISPPE